MFFGTGQVLTFSTFSGFAEIPLAYKIWPRKRMLVSKNWHFLGLIFRLNCFSLSNTSSIRSNILSIVGAKMQMSLRYSNRVTNCWSPKHCSIKRQKLEPAFKESKRHTGKLVTHPLNRLWMQSSWCHFHPSLVGDTPVPGQMKKTSYYCGQPAGLRQF